MIARELSKPLLVLHAELVVDREEALIERDARRARGRIFDLAVMKFATREDPKPGNGALVGSRTATMGRPVKSVINPAGSSVSRSPAR